jgi:hypothetical protein
VSNLGPKVLFVAVLTLSVSFPAKSFVQNSVPTGSGPEFSLHIPSPGPGQNPSFRGPSGPSWNDGGWGNEKKNPPVGIPEGGSSTMYLALAGFAFMTAIGFRRWQES